MLEEHGIPGNHQRAALTLTPDPFIESFVRFRYHYQSMNDPLHFGRTCYTMLIMALGILV